jgi:hypothetical protein
VPVLQPARALATVLVVALLTALAIAGPGAEARPAGVPPSASSLLPSLREVVAIYPDLEGGSRLISEQSEFNLYGAAADCLGLATLGTPEDGAGENFFTAQGGPAFQAGLEAPAPGVYLFATVNEARTAMAKVGAYVRRCSGMHSSSTMSRRLVALRNPRLGERALAFRTTEVYLGGDGTEYKDHVVQLVVRRGLELVVAAAASQLDRPSTARAVRLARLTLRTSS